MSEPRKVHRLSGRATVARPSQILVECSSCDGYGWRDGGSTNCPECNHPPVCRCERPRENRGGTHCRACGQMLAPEVEVDAGELAGETRPTIGFTDAAAIAAGELGLKPRVFQPSPCHFPLLIPNDDDDRQPTEASGGEEEEGQDTEAS